MLRGPSHTYGWLHKLVGMKAVHTLPPVNSNNYSHESKQVCKTRVQPFVKTAQQKLLSKADSVLTCYLGDRVVLIKMRKWMVWCKNDKSFSINAHVESFDRARQELAPPQMYLFMITTGLLKSKNLNWSTDRANLYRCNGISPIWSWKPAIGPRWRPTSGPMSAGKRLCSPVTQMKMKGVENEFLWSSFNTIWVRRVMFQLFNWRIKFHFKWLLCLIRSHTNNNFPNSQRWQIASIIVQHIHKSGSYQILWDVLFSLSFFSFFFFLLSFSDWGNKMTCDYCK